MRLVVLFFCIFFASAEGCAKSIETKEKIVSVGPHNHLKLEDDVQFDGMNTSFEDITVSATLPLVNGTAMTIATCDYLMNGFICHCKERPDLESLNVDHCQMNVSKPNHTGNKSYFNTTMEISTTKKKNRPDIYCFTYSYHQNGAMTSSSTSFKINRGPVPTPMPITVPVSTTMPATGGGDPAGHSGVLLNVFITVWLFL